MSSPPAKARHAAVLMGALAAAASLAAASCTVFSGLSSDPPLDASVPDTGPNPVTDGGTGDANGLDAGFVPPRLPDGGSFPSFFSSLDQAVQLCNAVNSCAQLAPSLQFVMGLPVQKGNFTACVDLFAGPRPLSNAPTASQRAMLAQILAAKTCAAQLQVLPYEELADDSPLCAAGANTGGGTDAGADASADAGPVTGAYCMPSPTKAGTTDTVSCDEGLLYHCASTGFVPGSNCDVVALDCVTPDPCGAAPTCQGAFQRTCDVGQAPDGGKPSEDCSLFGAVCDDALGCALDGRSAICDTPEPFKCAGAEISACIGTNAESVACPELGATCDDSHAYAFCALPGGCTPFSAGVNTCASDGSSITLCVGGEIVTYNCANAGLTCKADENFVASCAAQ